MIYDADGNIRVKKSLKKEPDLPRLNSGRIAAKGNTVIMLAGKGLVTYNSDTDTFNHHALDVYPTAIGTDDKHVVLLTGEYSKDRALKFQVYEDYDVQ